MNNTEAPQMRTALADLRDLSSLPATLSIPEAGRVGWGLSRAKSYQLAQAGRFPVEVRRVGERFHVRSADLLRALGIDVELLLASMPTRAHRDAE